jgi:PIN domain nuclease of toxin-antitoxin system
MRPHPDPADRIIAATALSLGASLVTKDEKLRSYALLRTICKRFRE